MLRHFLCNRCQIDCEKMLKRHKNRKHRLIATWLYSSKNVSYYSFWTSRQRPADGMRQFLLFKDHRLTNKSCTLTRSRTTNLFASEFSIHLFVPVPFIRKRVWMYNLFLFLRVGLWSQWHTYDWRLEKALIKINLLTLPFKTI